ncbi:MAG: hypothetical protein JW829_17990 [Pirellulales bacterium]|nr:hypothetical protein [Pirellulales bacterium]
MRSPAPLYWFLVVAIWCSDIEGTEWKSPRSLDPLDRGLVVRPAGGDKVVLSWRLLDSDPANVAFYVYSKTGSFAAARMHATPISKTTDFVATVPDTPAGATYFVRGVLDGKEMPPSIEVPGPPADDDRPYISIRLAGNSTFQKIGIADLDGDRRLDYVIKQPNTNVDPYIHYWKPSEGTYKLEAYSHEGEFLWRYDLGWAIECGIWYSPYVVYDFDGDGCAEVAVKTGDQDPRDANGRVQTGPEYLTILDGQTGKQIAQTDWIGRDAFPGEHGYNYASRNQLGVAYLDGKRPSIIVARGTYGVMKAVAYNLEGGQLRQVWAWENSSQDRRSWGQGAHWMHCADIDNDCRDEVLLGSIVLDDDGTALWSTGLGHPDHFYLADIDPERPGLEIYYGIETRQKERNGMCLVDAASGKILWGHEGATRHVHGSGLCGDIDPEHPGSECYSADSDSAKQFAWARLRNCHGTVICEENLGGFSPRSVYWDADLQRELLIGSRITKYRGGEIPTRIEGSLVAVADILGDWREEMITSMPGELRIYLSTIPATDRRVCLMQDPIYRTDVIHAAMGYYQNPMLSYDPASTSP